MIISNFGIIWPSDVDSQEILSKLKQESTVSLAKEVDIKNLEELVFDVYSFDKGLNICKEQKILDKIKRLTSRSHSKVIFVEFEMPNFEESVRLRNSIRKHFESQTSGPAFDIFHSGTSLEERDHLKNIILSDSTIESYSLRNALSQNLTNRLNVFKSWANSTSTSLNDVCIVGGAVLDLYGYKLCDDVDIVILKDIRDERNYGPRASMLTEGVDIVFYNYSKKQGIGNWYTDDELITNPDLFVFARGMKFANLEIVTERKKFSRRDKDLKDLHKINNNIKVS